MKQNKTNRKIVNPCYNTKTKTDCPRRAAGCREKCNKFKIYKTLKRIEQKQKDERFFFKELYERKTK